MLQLTIKDLKLFFKDKRSLLLTFVIPIALISLFAFAYGGVGKTETSNNIRLQVSDLDQTPASKEAIAQVASNASLEIKYLPFDSAQDAIQKGKESSVLVFYKGFSDSLQAGGALPVELVYDEAKSVEMGLLQQALIPILAQLPFKMGNSKVTMANKFERMIESSSSQSKLDLREKSDQFYDAIAKGMGESGKGTSAAQAMNFFDAEIKMKKIVQAKNKNEIGLIQAVSGTAIMMLLFAVVGIGMGLLEEKQEGTLKRLLFAPIHPIHILLGKMLYANIISILQLIIMFVFASLVFGLEIADKLPGLFITIVATAFACSAFGVFLASVAKTRQQVQGISTLIILVMSAIGGSMIPLMFMPKVMQQAAVFSVNYWSIQSFYDVLWRKLPIVSDTYLWRIAVLILIGVVLNSIALVMFRKNILKLT